MIKPAKLANKSKIQILILYYKSGYD